MVKNITVIIWWLQNHLNFSSESSAHFFHPSSEWNRQSPPLSNDMEIYGKITGKSWKIMIPMEYIYIGNPNEIGDTSIWRFPKIGVALNHPFFFGFVHHKPSIFMVNHPYFLGYPHILRNSTELDSIPFIIWGVMIYISSLGYYYQWKQPYIPILHHLFTI